MNLTKKLMRLIEPKPNNSISNNSMPNNPAVEESVLREPISNNFISKEPAEQELVLKENEILVLKRCIEGNKAYNDFIYGEPGTEVEAEDWENTQTCGYGLHGLTDGFSNYFDEKLNGNFVVIKVNKLDGYIELYDKVKFRKGVVLLNTSDIQEVKRMMRSVYPGFVFHWDINKQGNCSVNKQGNHSINEQGDYSVNEQGYNSINEQGGHSVNEQGNDSVNKQGNYSVNKQGYNSINKQGDYSVNKQGYNSINEQGDYSVNKQGYNSVNKQGNHSVNKQGDYSVNKILGLDNITKCNGERHCTIFLSFRSLSSRFFSSSSLAVYCEGKDYKVGETIKFKDSKIQKKYTTTPDSIETLEKYEIIVFGSNAEGNHVGGLAKTCVEKFGAIQGQSSGLQGQSYGINTMSGKEEIKKGLEELAKFATENTTIIIFLTKIGTGIAGYSEREIKFLLPDFPANVILPKGW